MKWPFFAVFLPIALLVIFNAGEMLPIMLVFLVAFCVLLIIVNKAIGKKDPD
tara:strand:- start:189 stop:344 length:156 start_codon:yes stop_codon:yes gene_type:complete